ncbi:hypothetical protein L249_5354 [Ophiocordyceps polyrhachis-furcata BCC 54312]|uniref:Uncharacterized protein n=1 Tax=Ophiocordyceps polyrhachis-furcata BCC 54312 TaxID=1330021 RepID=A0A367L991_9HYPO|nr:hypothetical protein L249_5354 [Ophiocordyceps polyrhachis-furcata BCC 54312]
MAPGKGLTQASAWEAGHSADGIFGYPGSPSPHNGTKAVRLLIEKGKNEKKPPTLPKSVASVCDSSQIPPPANHGSFLFLYRACAMITTTCPAPSLTGNITTSSICVWMDMMASFY